MLDAADLALHTRIPIAVRISSTPVVTPHLEQGRTFIDICNFFKIHSKLRRLASGVSKMQNVGDHLFDLRFANPSFKVSVAVQGSANGRPLMGSSTATTEPRMPG